MGTPAAARRLASWRSHLAAWFQLAIFRLTALKQVLGNAVVILDAFASHWSPKGD